MLGLYVSDHPLVALEAALARHDRRLGGRPRRADDAAGDSVRPRGPGAHRRRCGHRAGPPVHQAGRPDGHLRARGPPASIEVFVFPRTMADVGALLADDAIVVLRGRVDPATTQVKLVCMEVAPARAGRRRQRAAAPRAAPGRPHRRQRSSRLKEVLRRASRATSRSSCTWASKVLRLPGGVQRRQPATASSAELRVLLGPSASSPATTVRRRRQRSRAELGCRARPVSCRDRPPVRSGLTHPTEPAAHETNTEHAWRSRSRPRTAPH